MNLDVIIELLRKQMPDAGEEAIQAAAKELASETTKEEDRRANEAATTSIKNYEKKHGLRDGKTIEAPEPTPTPTATDGNDDTLGVINALRAEVEALKQSKVVDARKATFEALIRDLPEHLQSGYKRIKYSDLSDDEFDSLTAGIGEEVKGIIDLEKTRGLATNPRTPMPSPAGSESTAEDVEKLFHDNPSLGKI